MMNNSAVDIETEKKQPEDRVVRLASFLRIGTWALMGLVGFAFLLLITLLLFAPTNANGHDFLSYETVDDFKIKLELAEFKNGISLGLKTWIFLYFSVVVLWAFYCISRLHSLFGNFKNRNIFITRNSRLLRSFGYALIFGIVLNWLTFAIALLVININSQDSIGNILSNDFSPSSWITKFMMIGMAFLAAWIMEIGCELYSDSEYTI